MVFWKHTKKSKNDDRVSGTFSQPFVNKTGDLVYKTCVSYGALVTYTMPRKFAPA